MIETYLQDQLALDSHGEILRYNWAPDEWPVRCRCGRERIFPPHNFKGRFQAPRLMGVELEISTQDYVDDDERPMLPREHIAALHRYLSGLAICKYDGSIGRGYELVTIPMTLARHKQVGWAKLLEELAFWSGTSYEPGTCGLHVHVSRPALTDREIQRLRSFCVANRSWVRKFSQRKAEELNRWASIPVRHDGWRRGRYVGINVRRSTVEFRMFRGTLEPKRFLATLEFVDAICTWVKLVGISACRSKVSLLQFCEWAARQGEYPVFTNYMKRSDMVSFLNSRKRAYKAEKKTPLIVREQVQQAQQVELFSPWAEAQTFDLREFWTRPFRTDHPTVYFSPE